MSTINRALLALAPLPNVPIYTGNMANDAEALRGVAAETLRRSAEAHADAAKAWPSTPGQVPVFFNGEPITNKGEQVFWWLLEHSGAGVLGVMGRYELWLARTMASVAKERGIDPQEGLIKLAASRF